MKSVLFALITAFTFGAASLAADTKKPLAEWTCADFLGVEGTFRPKLIYWATAYSKAGKPESATIDIEGTEKVIPIITEDCEKAPQDSFWQKLESGWKRIEDEVKALEKKL
jgi:acid stress chaperone HdeA